MGEETKLPPIPNNTSENNHLKPENNVKGEFKREQPYPLRKVNDFVMSLTTINLETSDSFLNRHVRHIRN